MDYFSVYQSKLTDVTHALDAVQNGQRLFPAGVMCEPQTFLDNFHLVVPRLENVVMHKGRSDREYPFLSLPDLSEHMQVMGHLYDGPLRKAAEKHNVTHLPSFLHDFMKNQAETRGIDVFVAQTTPMDENGNLTVSGCGMWEYEAYENAKIVILEVNPQLPRFHGALTVPVERADIIYEVNYPVKEFPSTEPSETDRIIGAYAAEFVRDGDCIQLGLGGLPDLVGRSFLNKNDLGLHTELFTPVMGELIEHGNLTGAKKNIDTGLHVTSFVMGNRPLYDIMEKNPAIQFRPASYTNNPFLIAQIDNMKSLNTAMEIDLTGQICSESIGARQYSGTGGAFDFAYGALHSKGGHSIIAMASTAKGGTISKIKPVLTPGAVVSISRNAADIIITEYGVAYLCGRSVRERAEQLINIAHPDFRPELRKQARELLYI